KRDCLVRTSSFGSRIRERLDDCFRQNFTLAELAHDAGVHPIHLAREFRNAYSMPIGEYVRRRRIDAAMNALLLSDETLSAIALQAGFSSQPHLHKGLQTTCGLYSG